MNYEVFAVQIFNYLIIIADKCLIACISRQEIVYKCKRAEQR